MKNISRDNALVKISFYEKIANIAKVIFTLSIVVAFLSFIILYLLK